MKIFRFLILVTIVLTFSSNTQAQKRYSPPSEEEEVKQEESKADSDDIQFINGTPNRPFERLVPVWSTSMVSMERAIKGLKKQAAKVGADAIIEVKIETGDSAIISGTAGGWGGSSPQPVIHGWAVKWTGEEPLKTPESQPIKSKVKKK